MAQQVIKSGYLFKTPPRDKIKNIFADRWRLRWFKLFSNKTFSYFEDCNCTKAKGDIPLDRVDLGDIKHTLSVEGRKWVISIIVADQNREYFLAATDKECMMSWYKALEEVLKIDYILVTEVASTNTIMREIIDYSNSLDLTTASTGSAQYLELRAEKLERIDTEDSIFSDDLQTDETPLQLEDRASKVSPYVTYNVDDKEDIDDRDNQEDEDLYLPMNRSAVNSLDTQHAEPLHSPILNASKSLDLDLKKDSDYEINDLRDPEPKRQYVNMEIGEEPDVEDFQIPILNASYSDFDVQSEPLGEDNNNKSELEVPDLQPKISEDIYEMMNSPRPDEREIVQAYGPYDHLDGMQEHLKGILDQEEEKQKAERHASQNSVSSDYEDIAPFKKTGSASDAMEIPVRFGRALTEIVDADVFEPPKIPPKSTGLVLLEEFRRTSFGNLQQLLETYWVMYIFLPNKQIIKELVNLEAPVDVLLTKLAKLFTRHKHLHDFNLYVVSDVHQTYEAAGKKNDKECVKMDRRLNNEMSFLKQGITSCKLLQLISIKEIDQNIYKEYVREKNEMNLPQRFCETWIPFVRGYFSIPDLREVVSLCGYLHYIYEAISHSKNVTHSLFLPKTSCDIREYVKKMKDQSAELKDTPVETVCINFMKRLAVWPTANTIAFPIKRIGKGVLLNKQSDFLFVFASDHIGIVKADKNTDYSNFVYWWHKLDISGFEINSQKDILVIKLTKPMDEGNCDFQIKSSMNKILCQLLENFFTDKSHPLTKRVSVGANATKYVHKGLADI